MTNYKISSRAYSKMILHVAKYPHCAVNGLLLAANKDSSNTIEIVDIVPLFHQCLHVSPMAEIALVQTEAYAAANDLQIAGYYAASELCHENSIDKAPGLRIADKVAENNPSAAFLVIDNALLCSQSQPAAHIWQNKEGHWMPTSFTLNDKNQTLDSVNLLVKRGAMKDFYDFDNHLDCLQNDWTNAHLNRDLQQLLSMY